MKFRGGYDLVLAGKPAERIGFMDKPWAQTLKKWVDEGYPTDGEGKPVDAVMHFDFDIAGAGGWFSWDAKLNADEVIVARPSREIAPRMRVETSTE